MQLIDRQSDVPMTTEPEALIPEAHRLRRRRLAVRGVAALCLMGAIAAVTVNLSTANAGRRTASQRHAVLFRSEGLGAEPRAPAAMAVGPNGALYVADTGRDEILERLPNRDTFVVVAGNGRQGFSGDGGLATRAELRLRRHSGLAVSTNGAIYIADSGNDRVRAVLSNGRIATVAGGGTEALPAEDSVGVRAVEANLRGVNAVAIGRNGVVYIGARFVVRLTEHGLLDWVAGANGQSHRDCSNAGCPVAEADLQDVTGLALERNGSLVVSGGDIPGVGWPLAEIRADGKAIYLTATRGVGGQPAAVASASGGPVVVAAQNGLYEIPDGQTSLRLIRGGATGGTVPSPISAALTRSSQSTGKPIPEIFYGGDGIAVGPHGQVFADALPFIGLRFATIVELANGRATVLWRSR